MDQEEGGSEQKLVEQVAVPETKDDETMDCDSLRYGLGKGLKPVDIRGETI